jgi:integrase
MAEQWEKAARLAREKRFAESQARRVVSDIYEELAGTPLVSATTRGFLDRWIEGKAADTAPGTLSIYKLIAREFVASLAAKADADLLQITRADIAAYRNAKLRQTSVASANRALKVLRVAFGRAVKDGFLQTSPAAALDTLKRKDAGEAARRPFTTPEITRLLRAAPTEWKGAILFGIYTGQRLGDIARLTWRQVDVAQNTLAIVTRKTGRRVILPLAPPLLSHLATMDAGDSPDAPLFPGLAAVVSETGRAGTLSNQFYDILVDAGLAAPRTHRETGKGHSRSRKTAPLSFHSLRHTATSLLKTAGVPVAVVMDIIGHDTEAVSRQYTHVDEDSKRAALAKLPDFSAPTAGTPKPKRRASGSR